MSGLSLKPVDRDPEITCYCSDPLTEGSPPWAHDEKGGALHPIHAKCWIDWSKYSDKCPYCREKVNIAAHRSLLESSYMSDLPWYDRMRLTAPMRAGLSILSASLMWKALLPDVYPTYYNLALVVVGATLSHFALDKSHEKENPRFIDGARAVTAAAVFQGTKSVCTRVLGIPLSLGLIKGALVGVVTKIAFDAIHGLLPENIRRRIPISILGDIGPPSYFAALFSSKVFSLVTGAALHMVFSPFQEYIPSIEETTQAQISNTDSDYFWHTVKILQAGCMMTGIMQWAIYVAILHRKT